MARRLLLAMLAALMAACNTPAPAPSLTVGASSDARNTLLANVYAAGLRYYGTTVRVETVEDPLAALDAGEATVAAGFTGRLLQRIDPGSAARAAEQVYRAMAGALPEGLAAADYAVAAEDKAALAVTEATAEAWGSRELRALVDDCSRVRVGAVAGSRPPSAVGRCELGPGREFDTAATMFQALRSGAITAAWTSTAATGTPDGVVVLVDRKPALIPAQNVVALYRRNELGQMQLRAINEIAGVLDTVALVQMLGEVKSGRDPAAVAEEWLADNPLGR